MVVTIHQTNKQTNTATTIGVFKGFMVSYP